MDDDNWFEAVGDVCVFCVNDDLALWVNLQGPSVEVCSFCGESGFTTTVRELFAYMNEAICRDWSPASTSDQVPFSKDFQEFQPDRIESDQLLADLGAPLGAGLLEQMFCRVFAEEWIHDDHWAGTRAENLVWSWERFAEQVQTKTRFLVLREATDGYFAAAETPPHKMLDHLGQIFERTGLVKTLPAGEEIFRGRKHPPSSTFDKVLDLGAPTARHTGAQRMSPAGISFFYGSSDSETCLAELRGLTGEMAVVGKWESSRPLVVLDLAELPEQPGFFDYLYGDIRELLIFAHWFVREITKPMLAHDRPEVDYVPSQAVAEYIRLAVRDDEGGRIDGIRYRSVARTEGINLALFDGPNLHEGASPALTLLNTSEHRTEFVTAVWSPS